MFLDWTDWHNAFRDALDSRGIIGTTHGVGDDGIFFIFDQRETGILWTFDRQGVLKRYKLTNLPISLSNDTKEKGASTMGCTNITKI